MKKIFVLLFALVCALILISCGDGDVHTLEWVTLPKSVYAKGEELDKNAKVKIDGKEYTLADAIEKGATVSGFNSSVAGTFTLTVTFESLTINFQYTVEIPDPDPTVPDITWYTGKTSPYTINNTNELYGLAKLINEGTEEGTETFAGKIVKLGADIDLSGKVWIPIGESPRKTVEELTYEQLKARAGVDPDPSGFEDEAAYIAELKGMTHDYTNYVYLGKYLFAKKVGENSYEYYLSDQAVSGDKFFQGTFDGQNHKIIGLSDIGYTPQTTLVYANAAGMIEGYTFGLFGVVKGNVTVKNLQFEDVAITGAYYKEGETVTAELDSVGAAIGYSFGSGNLVIDNVKVLSGNITAYTAAGGIIGRSYTKGIVTIKNSENRANIIVDFHAGGMLGYGSNAPETSKTEFKENSNYGNIESKSPQAAGGMVNYIGGEGNVIYTNCRNFGDIKGITDADESYAMQSRKPDAKVDLVGCQNYGNVEE